MCWFLECIGKKYFLNNNTFFDFYFWVHCGESRWFSFRSHDKPTYAWEEWRSPSTFQVVYTPETFGSSHFCLRNGASRPDPCWDLGGGEYRREQGLFDHLQLAAPRRGGGAGPGRPGTGPPAPRGRSRSSSSSRRVHLRGRVPLSDSSSLSPAPPAVSRSRTPRRSPPTPAAPRDRTPLRSERSPSCSRSPSRPQPAAAARARSVPLSLRGVAAVAYATRWVSIASVAAQRALASSLLELPVSEDGVDGGEQPFPDVLAEASWDDPPGPSRLGLRWNGGQTQKGPWGRKKTWRWNPKITQLKRKIV